MLTDEQLKEIKARAEAAYKCASNLLVYYGDVVTCPICEGEASHQSECPYPHALTINDMSSDTDIPALITHILEQDAKLAHTERALAWLADLYDRSPYSRDAEQPDGAIANVVQQAINATKDTPQ